MRRGSFLSAMDEPMRRRLMARGTRKLYERGEAVVHQGTAGDAMLAIETGRADVESVAANGRRILLGHLGPGDLVGELSLLDRAPRSADVIAATPVTGVLLGFQNVKGFLLEHPEVMFGIVGDLAAKLRAANALAENRALDDGAARLARCLLTLAEKWGERRADGGTRIGEGFTQGELGQMCALSRENVNRRLRAWTREGWIATEEGCLVLRAPEVLLRIAEEAGDAG